MTPYLRVANVFDGFIDYSDVLSMNFGPSERDVYALQPGDILVNEGQSLDLVGRAAVFEGSPGAYCFQNTLIRYRPGPNVRSEFLQATFSYWLATGRFMPVAKRTTSMAHLGSDRFAQMPIAVPSIEEQAAICAVLDSADQRLENEQRDRAKLQLLRRGLMADLLTGQVRVSPEFEVAL